MKTQRDYAAAADWGRSLSAYESARWEDGPRIVPPLVLKPQTKPQPRAGLGASAMAQASRPWAALAVLALSLILAR